MKTKIIGTITLGLILGYSSLWAADIAGTWEGSLEVAPGNALKVQFIIAENADGSIAVTLNSPESGAIKNVAANSASLAGNVLTLEVSELSGAYAGVLQDGSIAGEWKQLDQVFPLALKPYKEALLSAETIATIVGRWQGTFEPPGQQVNVAFTVKSEEPGKITAVFEQLDAGAKLPLPDFEIAGSTISFRVGPNGPKYTGTISGENIAGQVEGGGFQFAGNFAKHDLDPQEYALNLSAEAKKLLLGEWNGEMTTPVGPVAAVFRFVEEQFVEEELGLIRGYFDSPDRGAIGIPVQEVSLADGSVTITISSSRSFTGTVSGNTIDGVYSQQGQQLPVKLEKGPLPTLALEIAPAAANVLLGNWTGKLQTPQGELTIGIRFEKTEDGAIVGYLDSPDQGMEGARIRFATFDAGKLTVKSSLLRLQYTGTVADNNITGQLSQAGQNMELNLARQ